MGACHDWQGCEDKEAFYRKSVFHITCKSKENKNSSKNILGAVYTAGLSNSGIRLAKRCWFVFSNSHFAVIDLFIFLGFVCLFFFFLISLLTHACGTQHICPLQFTHFRSWRGVHSDTRSTLDCFMAIKLFFMCFLLLSHASLKCPNYGNGALDSSVPVCIIKTVNMGVHWRDTASVL